MNNRTWHHFQELIEKALHRLADILLPKEIRVQELEKLGPDGLFENIKRAENMEKMQAIFSYKNALCRQAIWEIKYRGNKKLIQDFSLLLYDYILEEVAEWKTFTNLKNIILIPIPASPKRTREKGFNQCVLLAQELIRIDQERNGNNFTLLENFLIKKNDTVHQARVRNRQARLNNLVDSFSINSKAGGMLSALNGVPNRSESIPPSLLSKHFFLIIDDVITTGATMTEAFRALKTAGISPRQIRGFALAH